MLSSHCIHLNYPFSERYRISYVAKFGESEKSFKNRQMTFEETNSFLESLSHRALLLCECAHGELGNFTYRSGNSPEFRPGVKRTEALSFLQQFVEDAVTHSVSSTGSFEVVPHLKDDGSEVGNLSQYASKANLFLNGGITLQEIGVSNYRRLVRDEIKNLPRYKYILNVDVCLVRHLNCD